MFRKRQKKTFPKGTFIPMPARVFAIAQLSLAFMIILWNISQPFMGELFKYKSQLLLFQDVMGIDTSGDTALKSERLGKNRSRFALLEKTEQARLLKHYERLIEAKNRPFLSKLHRSFRILFFEIPFYEQIWLLLSLTLPILLLKRVEGAAHAIWLLPLVTAAYAYDNQLYGSRPRIPAEVALFPTEKVIVSEYLNQPLSSELSTQKEELLLGWKTYLIQEWTKHDLIEIDHHEDRVANSSFQFDQMAEQGEFAFNIARASRLPLPDQLISFNRQQFQEPLIFLAIYLSWNVLFAVFAWRSRERPHYVDCSKTI